MAFSTWQEHEKYRNYRRDRAGFERWLVDSRSKQTGGDAQLDALVALLSPIFHFLGDGYRSDILERRAWVLLYALCPDLLNGEDMVTAAKRWGVTKQAVHYQLKELRKILPDLVIDTDSRKGHALDKAGWKERHRQGQLRRHANRRELRAQLKLEGFNRRAAA
jgi:hypothetical protein